MISAASTVPPLFLMHANNSAGFWKTDACAFAWIWLLVKTLFSYFLRAKACSMFRVDVVRDGELHAATMQNVKISLIKPLIQVILHTYFHLHRLY